MKTVKRGLLGLWYYFWGNFLALFLYDKKYLQGKYFSGKWGGVCAVGWRWVTHDALARLLSGNNLKARYPVGGCCIVVEPENVEFDPDDLNNFQRIGAYYQAIGKIVIGKGTYIAQNCGLITANHDFADLDQHYAAQPITIGKRCWIGMNSVILPGVVLGDGTIVGAGSVVTKSFEKGHCVIAGNPAKKLRDITDATIDGTERSPNQ